MSCGNLVIPPWSGQTELLGPDAPDWQILLKLKADGIATLLPDLQQILALARALQVRFGRGRDQCRFDDAIRTAKTMFAIGAAPGRAPDIHRAAWGASRPPR